MSDVAYAAYFFLTVRSDASSLPSVFYYADDEWMAIELCKLFKSEFGEFCEHEFSHMVVLGDDTTQLVRLRSAVDEVSLYQDPDPGIYDPEPTRELLQLAKYYSRATQWESLLKSLQKQEPRASRRGNRREQFAPPCSTPL